MEAVRRRGAGAQVERREGMRARGKGVFMMRRGSQEAHCWRTAGGGGRTPASLREGVSAAAVGRPRHSGCKSTFTTRVVHVACGILLGRDGGPGADVSKSSICQRWNCSRRWGRRGRIVFCMPREKAHEHRLRLGRGPAMSTRRGSAAS